MQVFPRHEALYRPPSSGAFKTVALGLSLMVSSPAQAADQLQNLVPAFYSLDHSLAVLGMVFGADPALPVFSASGTVDDTGFTWSTSGTYLGQPLALSAGGTFDPATNAVNWEVTGSYAGRAWETDGETSWLSPTDFAIKDSTTIGGLLANVSGTGVTPEFNFGTSTTVGDVQRFQMIDRSTTYLFGFIPISSSEWTSGWETIVTLPDGTVTINTLSEIRDADKVGVTVDGGKPAGTIDFGGRRWNKSTITIRPVPEPATWATMLLGFGFVAFAMRQSRQSMKVRYSNL